MAYWTRAKNGNVKAWNSDKTAIKRATLRHLDNLSDESVDAYFQNINASRNSKKVDPESLSEKTRHYIEMFLTWLAGRGRNRHTISQHRTNLQTAAMFFDHQGTLATWPRFSVKLRVYLKEKSFSENHINKIQMSTSQFWKYLRKHERIVEGGIDFDETVGHAKSKTTPLKVHLTPDEVLKWVNSCQDARVQLIAILGYFASLRPQETFAMTVSDFIGGHEAKTFECSKVMASIDMFDGFTIDVMKQRGVKKDEISDPKKHSLGIVSVFNKDAAILLVATIKKVQAINIAEAEAKVEAIALKALTNKSKRTAKSVAAAEKAVELARNGVLFMYGNRYYEKLWSTGQSEVKVDVGQKKKDKWGKGIPSVTLKDLRRASGYWLANYTQIKLESLHLHMRHKDVQTTSLYFRRAKEQPKNRVLDIV